MSPQMKFLCLLLAIASISQAHDTLDRLLQLKGRPPISSSSRLNSLLERIRRLLEKRTKPGSPPPLQLTNETCTNCSSLPWTPIEDCARQCDGVPKHCYAKLHIEKYTVLGPACGDCENGVEEDCLHPQCVTADGFKRVVIVANRQVPIPPLQMCRGDCLTVDVHNHIPEQGTTIHWHGFRQVDTQYFDGVPFVTQCPILPGTTFRYHMCADDAGTFFDHSHLGVQKSDGASGALIVRDVKENDIHSHLYDEDLPEHVIVINDWTHVPAEHLAPGLHHETIGQNPVTFLINGRARHYDDSSNIPIPLAEFVVEKGKRYRFRLIGANCMTCGAAVSFQNHTLLAISADGGLTFEPVEVNSVILNPADRFDVILNANQEEGVYRMDVRGFTSGCGGVYQVGVLRYKNAPKLNDTSILQPDPDNNYGIVFNDITSDCEGNSVFEVCISHLQGTTDAPKVPTNSSMYHQFELDLNAYFIDQGEFFQEGKYISYNEPAKGLLLKQRINSVSFELPPSTLLSQYDDIPEEALCSDECMAQNVSEICSCTNIFKAVWGSVVDIIVTERAGLFSHPFHLHGHNFYILEMRGGIVDLDEALADLKERLRNDQISTENKPQRDTISVPFAGYAAIRFVADNPGYWLFHCHFAFHLEGGMGGVLQIGEEGDWPPVPENFPRCGNYLG